MTTHDTTSPTHQLANGRDYYWALRQAFEEGDRDRLRDAGIDMDTLLALKALDPTIARPPHPTANAANHRYFELELSTGVKFYMSPILTEPGVEVGTELVPGRSDWTFAHDEIQYCTGGHTKFDAVLPHGLREKKIISAGDVVAMAAGTRVIFNPSEGPDRFGHAHVYLLNLTDGLPRTYYDSVSMLGLRQSELLDGDDEIPPLVELGSDRIEVMDWSDLVEPRDDGAHQLPTWLRNGWARREATRALDYAERGRQLVVSSPDRVPADYLPWGVGPARCHVNPIIAEAHGSIVDCRFPAGFQASYPSTEIWTVLRGAAQLRQTLPPLHVEEHATALQSGVSVVIPGGSRIFFDDATEDLVVRRLATSCASNAHWAMMEAKLIEDGVSQQL